MYEAVIAATLLGIPVISWVVVVLLAAVLVWGIVLIVRYERELRGKVRRKPAKRVTPELQQTASDTVEQSAEVTDVVSDDELPVSVYDEQAESEELTVAEDLDEELDEQPIDEPQAADVTGEPIVDEQPVEAVAENIEEEPVEDQVEIAPDEQPEATEIAEIAEDVEIVQEVAETIEDISEATEQVDELAETVVVDDQEASVSEFSDDEQFEEVAENAEVEQDIVSDESVEEVVDDVDAAVAESLTFEEQSIDESQAADVTGEPIVDEQPVEAVVEDIADESVIEIPPEIESDEHTEATEIAEIAEDVGAIQEVAEAIDDISDATEQVDDEQTEEVSDEKSEAIESEVAEQVEGALPESDVDFEPSEVAENVTEQPIEELADVETVAAEAEPIDEQLTMEQPAESIIDSASTDVDSDDVDTEGADADDAMSGEMVFADKTIFVRYSKSFTAKLVQSSDETKQFYAEIANCLLSYKKVNGRISWAYSSFNRGRIKLAKLVIRGKSLNLYLALDPSTVDKKYHVLDVSNVRKYAAVPCRLRIKSARAVKYAKELIAQACENLDILANPKFTPTVQAADYPYDTTENLIIAKLIKVNALNGEVIPEEHIVAGGFTLRESVSVDEAHELITDETAATLVENRRTAPISGKKYIVNIDLLSGSFNAGDVVDIEALKRKKLVPRKEKAIKVLARGVLNKPLVVKANDFSNDAIKMIVLTGGKAIKI